MKCEICHKRDATTAYTHIVDDVKKTLLLCADCIPTEKKNDEEKPVGVVSAKGQTKQDVPTLIKKAKVEFAASAAESGAVA